MVSGFPGNELSGELLTTEGLFPYVCDPLGLSPVLVSICRCTSVCNCGRLHLECLRLMCSRLPPLTWCQGGQLWEREVKSEIYFGPITSSPFLSEAYQEANP